MFKTVRAVLISAGVFLAMLPVLSLAAGYLYVDSNGNVGIGNTSPQHALDVSGAIYSRLVTASSTTINWNSGNVQTITLTSSPSLMFSNAQEGGEYKLILKQDGTGGRNVTWPVSVLWKSGTSLNLTSSANAVDVASFVYDGTNFLGSLGKNYSTQSGNVSTLVVAGGGSGGLGTGGGGGGGGVVYNSSYLVTSGVGYTVTVGTGGTAQTANNSSGNNGNNSVFDTMTADGGGGGGHWSNVAGSSGGSGGGGGGTSAGGSATQGNSGGGTGYGSAGGTGSSNAGGGGGATAAGASNGSGGTGYTSSISGASVIYGSGGGAYPSGTPGSGGGTGNSGSNGGNGTANTGGGGGGSDGAAQSGAGGSGIVIISAPIGTISGATGGSHTTSGGNDIWTFTSSGTWTPTF